MPLFKKEDSDLVLINAVQAISEKALQRMVEGNLKNVLDMYFLATEYRIPGGRIDTLAVDSQGAPVIIEYKRNRNDNVINQSLSYLKWLTAQQPEFFEMLMQKQLDKDVFDNLRLDWNNPRVVCIAESFSQFDCDTVEMVGLRIELFKYRLFDGGLISIDAMAIGNIKKSQALGQVLAGDAAFPVIQSMKEQCNASHLIRTLFDELREWILALDQHIIEKAGKRCIAYQLTKNFAEILIRKDRLVIDLRPIDYQDPRSLVERIASNYTVTLNRRVTLTQASDLTYVQDLIEQSYQNIM